MGSVGTWAQVEDGKGGGNRTGKAGTDRARNSFGPPGMVGKYIRVVADGGQERCPGGRSLCDQAREVG